MTDPTEIDERSSVPTPRGEEREERSTDDTTPDEIEPADDAEPETFPLAYVQQLRQENAEARVKAKRVDDLSQRLHLALTAATGRLADPTDLPYDESHLEDPEALTAAIDKLVGAKPHLASRRPAGNVGQGASKGSDEFSLAGLLRSRAS